MAERSDLPNGISVIIITCYYKKSMEVAEKIRTFFANYTLRAYAKGQVLLLADEEAHIIFYLESGRVKSYDVSYRGDEVIVNVFRPLAFFPMSLAMNGGKSAFIYEAETDIQVRQAPAEAVVTFVKENPDVLYDLLSRVYRGMDGVLGRMAQLMSGNASSRVLYELVIECRRFGKPAPQGCEISLSEKDLAARVGLSRETVNREVSKLKKKDYLIVHPGGMIVRNIAQLAEKLGQEI